MEEGREHLCQQHYAIKFFVKQGKALLETSQSIYGMFENQSIPQASVYHWHDASSKGKESMQLCSGQRILCHKK